MIKAQEVVKFLNELTEVDRDAMSNLVDTRVPCNDKLADHPTVQVLQLPGDVCRVGFLGILNGIYGVGTDGRGFISANYNEKNELVGFQNTSI